MTLKPTDPLYMLDFSEPESPKILGELETNSYSDSLHPIGENYLLEIGKKVISRTSEYCKQYGGLHCNLDQGIKLSLFDVSDGNDMHEIQSIIIGKRGSWSSALYDYRAVAWLPSTDPERFRLTIPIHENSTPATTIPNVDNDGYYDWTQTGAYVFDIHTGQTPSLTQSDQLITESRADGDQYSYYGYHQIVPHGSALHYIHNSTLYSKELNP